MNLKFDSDTALFSAKNILQYTFSSNQKILAIVTLKQIEAGETISSSSIETRVLATNDVTTGFISSKSQVIGRIALKTLRKNVQVEISALEDNETFYSKLLRDTELALGMSSMEVARILDLFADSYWNIPQISLNLGLVGYSKAERLQKRSLEIHEKKVGLFSLEVAEDCRKLFLLCQRQNKKKQAQKFLERRVNILELHMKGVGSELLKIARANVESEPENTTRTFELFGGALIAVEAEIYHNVISLIRVIQDYAEFCVSQNKIDEAETLFKRIILINQLYSKLSAPELSSSLRQYGQFLNNIGRCLEAEKLFSDAEEVAKGQNDC